MILLDEFEGISGYRWSALIDHSGEVTLSKGSPEGSAQKVAFVKRILGMAELPLTGADLFFEKGKVVVRQGAYGLLLLFCDNTLNSSMLGFVLAEMERSSQDTEPDDMPDLSSTPTGSSIQIIQPFSGDAPKVPATVMSELMSLYVEFLGPLAPALARKEIEKADMDLQQITTDQWGRLLDVLAARISDNQKHEAFLDRAVMLKTQF